MAAPRIYTPGDITCGEALTLDASASRHLAGALRMKVGDTLVLFNGDGSEYDARISQLDRRSVTVLPGKQRHMGRESPLAIHLGIGISRGERMDWVVQKSTELGVSEVSPLFTERCEVKLRGDRADRKLAHWRQIAISACEQSGRNHVPLIHPPQAIDAWQTGVIADLRLVLHHRESGKACSTNPRSLALLVGPEGGLTETEIEHAQAAGFRPAELGPRVLRTETAPLAAIAIAQARWGDMGASL